MGSVGSLECHSQSAVRLKRLKKRHSHEIKTNACKVSSGMQIEFVEYITVYVRHTAKPR